MKCICIYSYSPDLVGDRTKEDELFQSLFFFCSISKFFYPADFLSELKYSMTTWQKPERDNSVTDYSILMCFPKYA